MRRQLNPQAESKSHTSVQPDGNGKGAPHSAILKKLANPLAGFETLSDVSYLEWHHRVLACLLPVDPDRNEEESNNEWCDHLGGFPLCGHATCKSEWDQDTGEHADHENHTHDIEMPEELDYHFLAAQKLE